MNPLTIQNPEAFLTAIQHIRQESTTICKHLEKTIIKASPELDLHSYIITNRQTVLSWGLQINYMLYYINVLLKRYEKIKS